MKHLTKLIGCNVLHVDGERLGKVNEVVVTPAEPLPILSAFQVKTDDGAVFLPVSYLDISHDFKETRLKIRFNDIQPYQIKADDFSLVRDVLDRQIVDVHDYRVVRVNDIVLEQRPDGRFVLVGVDAGVYGLFRRLGLEGPLRSIGKLLRLASSDENIIAWQDVESLPRHNAGDPLKLKISVDRIGKLHPADIADILEQLEPSDRKHVLEQLDLETAADALAEADDEVQLSALQHLDEERAADILEEMPADEAADVLGDMDVAHREDLLGRMDEEEREDVKELLPYNDATAGGLMTNEFVAIKPSLTAQGVIETLRSLEPEAETIYYVYVIDEDDRLVGVISLRDLIISPAEKLVSDFMITKVRTVNVNANVEEVASKFEKYGLLAIPVVDEHKTLQGIITIDDTLEQLLPEDWRNRRSRIGGKSRDREAVA